MLDLSPELEELKPPAAAAVLARERREVFSIHPELRALSWAGAVLIATGAAILLAKHYESLGPLVLAIAVGLAAMGAYAYAAWRGPSLVNDYVLLLGALLLSADLAFIEAQFHLLDRGWPRHLLLLAAVHGVTAYWFRSRTLLSLSIVALAGWLGIEQRVDTVFRSTTETAIRALLCSSIVLLWRFADAKWHSVRTFERVFEHFAANLALAAGLILVIEQDVGAAGVLLTMAIAAVVTWRGFKVKAESFVIYAYAYAFLAVMVFFLEHFDHSEISVVMVLLVGSVAGIAGLFLLHGAYVRARRT